MGIQSVKAALHACLTCKQQTPRVYQGPDDHAEAVRSMGCDPLDIETTRNPRAREPRKNSKPISVSVAGHLCFESSQCVAVGSIVPRLTLSFDKLTVVLLFLSRQANASLPHFLSLLAYAVCVGTHIHTHTPEERVSEGGGAPFTCLFGAAEVSHPRVGQTQVPLACMAVRVSQHQCREVGFLGCRVYIP